MLQNEYHRMIWEICFFSASSVSLSTLAYLAFLSYSITRFNRSMHSSLRFSTYRRQVSSLRYSFSAQTSCRSYFLAISLAVSGEDMESLEVLWSSILEHLQLLRKRLSYSFQFCSYQSMVRRLSILSAYFYSCYSSCQFWEKEPYFLVSRSLTSFFKRSFSISSSTIFSLNFSTSAFSLLASSQYCMIKSRNSSICCLVCEICVAFSSPMFLIWFSYSSSSFIHRFSQLECFSFSFSSWLVNVSLSQRSFLIMLEYSSNMTVSSYLFFLRAISNFSFRICLSLEMEHLRSLFSLARSLRSPKVIISLSISVMELYSISYSSLSLLFTRLTILLLLIFPGVDLSFDFLVQSVATDRSFSMDLGSFRQTDLVSFQ